MFKSRLNNLISLSQFARRKNQPVFAQFVQIQNPFYQGSRNRYFSTSDSSGQTNEEAISEVTKVLKDMKTEEGKSMDQINIIHSVGVDAKLGMISIKLNLRKDYRKAKALIQDKLNQIEWVRHVKVEMAPKEQTASHDAASKRTPGLRGVKHIIAVSSCKGGVGKSTVSVNLAFSLMKMGHKIGIFDADMYGPSLPTMISPDQPHLYQDELDASLITPINFAGVKCMSYGFASSGKTAIMRGPMVSNLVVQLIGQTNWGELDYLVIDFPPGTGDIQLTLGQELNLSGAVIVTTPQKLSYVDVTKGIDMFDELKVPTIALVENMAYYKCTSCDEKHRIFGRGFTHQIKTNYGIQNSFEVPIVEEIAQMSDSGTPFVLSLPDSLDIVQTYSQLASQVVTEIEKLLDGGVTDIKYDPLEGKVICKFADGSEKRIDPLHLRSKCLCAACVDEVDGRQIFKINQCPKDVHPTNMVKKGNYAVAIVWSDGHRSSIYPYERLQSSQIEGEEAN